MSQPTLLKSDPVSANEHHRLVAEHVCDIVSVHDLEGRFEFVSPSVEGILGYRAQELLGRSPYDFLHPEDSESLVRPVHDQLLQGRNSLFRCRFRHKDGRWIWLEVTNDFVPGEDGRPCKLITSSRDITLRKGLEDRIRMFEKIVEVATDAIVVTDPEERIIYVNPVFERRTGYPLAEIRGRRPGDFLQGPDSDRVEIARIRKAVRERRIGTFELKNYTRSGEAFFVRMLIQPLFDKEGHHEGFFALQQDISTEREARENLKLLNARLKEKNVRLRSLNKDLEEFAYIVSHDLKEPLRNVIGLLQIFEESAEGKIDQQDLEMLELATEACNRMTRMIESLLDYSRTGYPSERPGEIRIREVLDSIGKDFRKVIASREATIRFKGDDLHVCGYPTAIHRLLQNLISNSLKYGRETGILVEVTVSESPQEWTISVRDNGPGIPRAQQQEIFKLFNRLSNSPDSNGIGLALCRRIAKLHKGRISVASNPGEGATFDITLSKQLNDTN